MQQLLAQYLYQYKYCSLPQVGTLQITATAPPLVYGEQALAGLQYMVEYSDVTKPTQSLISFIAIQKSIGEDAASQLLADYCATIKLIKHTETYMWQGIGTFSRGDSEQLIFTPTAFTIPYYPTVKASRVVHPNVSHSMVVGEKLTNSADMAQQLAKQTTDKSKQWWAAAALFFLLALALIIYYETTAAQAQFGNATKIIPTVRLSTYVKL